jgi:hypothetical protein
MILSTSIIVYETIRIRLNIARGILKRSIRMSTHSLQGRLVLRHEALGLPVSSHGAYQGRASPKRMTDSKEEGELRGTVKCLLPGKERSLSEENVRTWERECESEHDGVYREAYFPQGRGGSVVPVATLLGTGLLWPSITSLERQLPILLEQGPVWTGEPSARPGTSLQQSSIGPTGQSSLPQQIRSQERARYEGSVSARKGCSTSTIQ